MPKVKTKRAAAKRFKLTKSGLVKRAKAYKSHILNKKSTKRKKYELSILTVLSSVLCLQKMLYQKLLRKT